MMKLGKEIMLGEMIMVEIDKWTKLPVRVVMNGKTKGVFTSRGFIQMKQRTEYLVVA